MKDKAYETNCVSKEKYQEYYCQSLEILEKISQVLNVSMSNIFVNDLKEFLTKIDVSLEPYQYLSSNIVSGILYVNKEGDSIIGINSNQSVLRQNFTLAHEIAHLFCDVSENNKSQGFMDRINSSDDFVEERANYIASLLLCNTFALRKIMQNFLLFDKFQKIFGLSEGATWVRIFNYFYFEFGISKKRAKMLANDYVYEYGILTPIIIGYRFEFISLVKNYRKASSNSKKINDFLKKISFLTQNNYLKQYIQNSNGLFKQMQNLIDDMLTESGSGSKLF